MSAADPPEAAPGRAHHDLGGVSRFLCEPIDTGAHALGPLDREVDAIRQLLGAKGIMTVDELRRGIEAIPEAEYHRLGYYERWLRAITATLLRKGVLGAGELEAALHATAPGHVPPEHPAPEHASREHAPREHAPQEHVPQEHVP